MSYKHSFFSGIAWNGGLKVFSKLLTAVKLFILARLLLPQDFGLFSLVLVSVSLIEVFTESGINTILVQSQKKLEEYLGTAWIISIGRGVLIAGAMVFLSFVMSHYYQESRLQSLILFASLVPLIRGCINPAIISFYKNLKFRQDTYYRLTLVITDLVTAILFGFILRNPFALIMPMIVSALVEVFVSYKFVHVWPNLHFNKAIFEEILSQTKWLNGIAILDYLTKNADNLIIGRFLGTTQLGFYQNAFALSQSATSELGLSVIHASFPIYTRFSEDTARLKRAFIKVSTLFCFILLIPLFILIAIPDIVVHIQFGEGWEQIIPILPILALSGYIQGLFNIGSTVFTVRKKYYYLTTTLGLLFTGMIVGLLILIPQYGLMGGAISILISRLVTLPFFLWFIIQSLKTNETAQTSSV